MKKGYGLKGEVAVMPEVSTPMRFAHIRMVLNEGKEATLKSKYINSEWGQTKLLKIEKALKYLNEIEGVR